MRLISNFIDYYDHYFDLHGEVFRRMSNEGMNRKEMLEFMCKQNLPTPIFGIVSHMKHHPLINDEVYVVIHTDINSHRGENKILLRYAEALEQYPESFMVMYASSIFGVSWRYLRVGDYSFILRYESDDWRSNWSTKLITIENKDASEMSINIDVPLFAIDFVKKFDDNGNQMLLAIDYNIAPQIRGTGVENILTSIEAASSIKIKQAKHIVL